MSGSISMADTSRDYTFQRFCDSTLTVAYVENVVFLVWGKSRNQLEKASREAPKILKIWSGYIKIEIFKEKSKVLIFGKPKILQRPPILKLQSKNIKDEKTIKYLRIHIDKRLFFFYHICKLKDR